jgi:hypothetical protein
MDVILVSVIISISTHAKVLVNCMKGYTAARDEIRINAVVVGRLGKYMEGTTVSIQIVNGKQCSLSTALPFWPLQ